MAEPPLVYNTSLIIPFVIVRSLLSPQVSLRQCRPHTAPHSPRDSKVLIIPLARLYSPLSIFVESLLSPQTVAVLVCACAF
jgi:hypothetical protein